MSGNTRACPSPVRHCKSLSILCVQVIAGLHHDWAGKSEQYVKEPERFMPERWLRGNSSAHANIHPFIVMPFGFGPRSCVGRRFAEQELFLALIKVSCPR